MLLQDKRILIVEDDPYNASLIQMLLEREGAYVIRGHWTGDDFDECLKKNADNLHLIMLDLMLPDNVSGYDILKQIRAMPSVADIPVVAVSASDPMITIPRVREAGFNGFIAKPLNFEQFKKDIHHLIEGGEVWVLSDEEE